MSSQKRHNLISREYDIAEIKLLIDAVESSKFITKKKSEELVAKLSKMAGRNQAEQLRRNISAEDRILKRPDILEEEALPFPGDFDFEKHLQTSFRMFGTKYTMVDLICANDLMDARFRNEHVKLIDIIRSNE